MQQPTARALRRAIWTILLVLGMLLLSACAAGGTGGSVSQATATSAAQSPTASPTATAASGKTVSFATIAMMSATTGWAVGSQHGVFRTTDGGAHWQDVAPTPASGQWSGVFLTAALAWVDYNFEGAGTPALYKTTTGGQTWQQVQAVQDGFASQPVFIDAEYGWLMASHGAAAGSEPVDIFRTLDGGVSWTKVQSGSFSPNNPPGALPPGGDKSGLSFRDASTGWVTGEEPAENFSYLYITHDGGVTWQQQNLPMPQGVTAAYFSINPPTFFNANAGILPVTVDDATTNASALDVYVTHDGGTTWQPTALLNAGNIDFIDAAHGWATDGAALYVTSDGAQHWQKLSTSSIYNNMDALDFVSSTLGWAISAAPDSVTDTTLLKTTDGGQTWAPVTTTG